MKNWFLKKFVYRHVLNDRIYSNILAIVFDSNHSAVQWLEENLESKVWFLPKYKFLQFEVYREVNPWDEFDPGHSRLCFRRKSDLIAFKLADVPHNYV